MRICTAPNEQSRLRRAGWLDRTDISMAVAVVATVVEGVAVAAVVAAVVAAAAPAEVSHGRPWWSSTVNTGCFERLKLPFQRSAVCGDRQYLQGASMFKVLILRKRYA